MNKVVTIIVPVYNTESYLAACLESLRRQSYEQIEVLVVNDCSPDNSAAIAADFASRDSRFRVLAHERNGGLSRARNTGMAQARGEYIMFLDSDDRFARDAVELMYRSIEQSGCDFVIGRMFLEAEGVLSAVNYVEERLLSYYSYHDRNLRHCPVEYAYYGSVTNRIFRRSFLLDNKLSFLEGIYWEDMPFSLLAWLKARGIGYEPGIVTLYNRRDDPDNPSISHCLGFKKFTDRDMIFRHVAGVIDASYAKDAQALALAINFMQRFLGTTGTLVPQANDDCSKEAEAWFKKHRQAVAAKIDEWKSLKAALERKG